jgi:two-component system, cell cycle sensor histidine kinase and response regulator CckA
MCKREERIDLLVTDLILPHIDGTKLAETVTTSRPEMRVLFVSGYAPESFSQRHVKLPGGVFLGKPFTPVMLAHKVREALGEQRTAAPLSQGRDAGE